MKRRKSPHKHKVRTKHSRYKVSSYDRGKGDKPSQRSKRERKFPPAPRSRKLKTKKPASSGDGFDVRIEYQDRSFEHVDVNAPAYTEAISPALDGRKWLKEPRMIRLRRL